MILYYTFNNTAFLSWVWILKKVFYSNFAVDHKITDHWEVIYHPKAKTSCKASVRQVHSSVQLAHLTDVGLWHFAPSLCSGPWWCSMQRRQTAPVNFYLLNPHSARSSSRAPPLMSVVKLVTRVSVNSHTWAWARDCSLHKHGGIKKF